MNRNQCIEKIKLALEFQCEKQLAIGCEIEEYFEYGMISDNDDVCEADNFDHLKYVSKERMSEIMNKSEEDYQEEYEQIVKDMNDCCC